MSSGPPTWFLVLWVLLIGWSVLAWTFYLRWHARNLPRRAGSRTTPSAPALLSARGGGRIGWLNVTAPLVWLRIDGDGIVFKFAFATASLAWSDVTRATLVRPLIPLGQGVEFSSHAANPLTFWGNELTCARIIDLCSKHGVVVVRDPELRL